VNAPNGNGRRRHRQTGELAAKAVVGSWWISRYASTETAGGQPRQIVAIEQGPFGPVIRWAGYGRYKHRPKAITLARLVADFDPCASPVAVAPAPAVTHEPPAPSLRAIVREEVRAALADFAAELRPAMRAEALAAVKAAFGEVVS